jgi:hypothetical protein
VNDKVVYRDLAGHEAGEVEFTCFCILGI